MEAYFLKTLPKVELSKRSRKLAFYPQQETAPLCLISERVTALAGAHYSCIAAIGTSFITVTVLQIQKDILIHVALNGFFFPQ